MLNSHVIVTRVTYKILMNLSRRGQDSVYSAFRRFDQDSHSSAQILPLHVVGSELKSPQLPVLRPMEILGFPEYAD